jgi:hypothetical protein
MSLNFASFITARRRACILAALADADRTAPGTQVAVDLLHKYCLAIGMRPTLHTVELDMTWLSEQHLIETSRLSELLLGRITQHGREASSRRVQVAGLDFSEVGS